MFKGNTKFFGQLGLLVSILCYASYSHASYMYNVSTTYQDSSSNQYVYSFDITTDTGCYYSACSGADILSYNNVTFSGGSTSWSVNTTPDPQITQLGFGSATFTDAGALYQGANGQTASNFSESYFTIDFGAPSSYDIYEVGQSVLTYGTPPSPVIIITSPVPVPAAVWLFSSGLLGLIGVARRKARA